MTTAQIIEAIDQMRSACEGLQAAYEPVSARGLLYSLGYDEEQAESVLRHIHAGGFTYCLDPHFAATHYSGDGMATTYPTADVCYWGPDQLKSRLDALSNAPRNYR